MSKAKLTEKLTEKFIRSLAPREGKKQFDVYDSKLSGLGLSYSNGGARTFFVFWRDATGTNRRTSIGRYDQGVSVNEARSRARAKLAEIAKELKAGINRPTERQAPTMGDLVDRYLAHAEAHVEPGTLIQVKGIARRCFTPELRAQKLSSFTREQIEELHGAVGRTRGQIAANNFYRLTRLMFNLGIDWKMLAINPCRRIRLFPEATRTRHLSRAEAERLNEALMRDPDWRWRALFPLLLFTGLRKNELLSLEWARVDLGQRTLTVPKTKSGKPIVKALIEEAVRILVELPSRGVSKWVFPGDVAGAPLSAPDKAWVRIRTRAGLPDVRIHDLRHSFASFLINAGVPLYTVSKALGHSSVVMSQRYAFLEHQTVREAMEAARIGSVMAGAITCASKIEDIRSNTSSSASSDGADGALDASGAP
jgi:integrase